MGTLIKKREAAPATVQNEWDPFRAMRQMMRWDPFRDMLRWEPLAESFPMPPEIAAFAPNFEVKETKESYLFKADLPGVKEEEVEISLVGNRLTVNGKREAEKVEEGDTFYTRERSYGSFNRAFTLPEGVDLEHVQAELKNGVLAIVVPKKPEAQPRKVEVKLGEKAEKAKA